MALMPSLECSPALKRLTPHPSHPWGNQIRDLIAHEFSGYYPEDMLADNLGDMTYHMLDILAPGTVGFDSGVTYYALGHGTLYAVGVVKEEGDNNRMVDDSLELTMLATVVPYRGYGYGSYLLDKIEQISAQEGKDTLVVQSTDGPNGGVTQFYRDRGFELQTGDSMADFAILHKKLIRDDVL